jgi:hypothetical protein
MMKMTVIRNKITRFGITGAALAASAILGFNCSPFSSKQIPSAADLSSSGTGTTPDPQLSIALLSSEQILKAMISAAGIESAGTPTADDDLINTTYSTRAGSLPSDQNLKLATGPMLISVTNLASAVCAKAVNEEIALGQGQASSRNFFREMDFTQGLSAQPSNSVSLAFERLARNGWRREVTASEDASIVQFAQEFSTASGNLTDPAQTRLLAVSVCTAVLSSIDALTY